MPRAETLRGPEPPFVGAVYRACTKSGRRWEVHYHEGKREGEDLWRLAPMGEENGAGFSGGVKAISVTTSRLRDRKRWRMVGVSRRAVYDANSVDGKYRLHVGLQEMICPDPLTGMIGSPHTHEKGDS